MSAGRLFTAAFVCLVVAGVILAFEGRALSVTSTASLISAAFAAAAVVLSVMVIRRR